MKTWINSIVCAIFVASSFAATDDMEYIPLGWAIKDSVCLGKMEPAVSYTKNGTTLEFSDGSKITHGNYILESDIGNFKMMSLMEKEFSVPKEITICADESHVFGMQLTTIMHRFEYHAENALRDKYPTYDEFIENINQAIVQADPRRMKFIGTDGGDWGNCHTVEFVDFES